MAKKQRRLTIGSKVEGGEMAGRILAIEAIVVALGRRLAIKPQDRAGFVKDVIDDVRTLGAEFKHPPTLAHAEHFVGRLVDDILFAAAAAPGEQ